MCMNRINTTTNGSDSASRQMSYVKTNEKMYFTGYSLHCVCNDIVMYAPQYRSTNSTTRTRKRSMYKNVGYIVHMYKLYQRKMMK